MQEQRKNEADPSRKPETLDSIWYPPKGGPETLGEGVVLDAMKIAGGDPLNRKERLAWFREHTTYSPSITCQIIDSRFAPLIEAAEWALDTLDNKIGLIQPELENLRAAIAKAKGGAQ